MSLQTEIDKNRSDIRTDAYSMSIGELINIYNEDELDIHPEFQRFYRWSEYQKSRLIESLFLGIPIPEIFVSQREDGVWDVVDGLQRLSTIFQFVGVLRDENNKYIDPLTLVSTKYLPSMEGKKWKSNDNKNELTQSQKLLFKRAKLNVTIIQRESTESTKYELFLRLNTGGSQLSDQEVRNSAMIMTDPEIYQKIRELSQNPDFQECISLTDKALVEQYDMELVVRYIVFRKIPLKLIKNIGDIGEFLTDQIIQIFQDKSLNYRLAKKSFERTFSLLKKDLGSNSFRKYDPINDKFSGGFLVSAFEIIALGIGHNILRKNNKIDNVESIIKQIWTTSEFASQPRSGVRASTRIPTTISIGRRMFKNVN